MESFELLQQLTKAIEKDFKDLKDELIQEKDNSKLLKDTTETLQSTIKELKHDNAGLVKALRELKDKYGRLHDKMKRKQEEINKKEKWWDKYRYTAETTIKKLRTLGSFSPDVLLEVSRDLVDIMDDGSSTETVSSQEKQHRKEPLKKLSTTKYNKKKYRYADISPDNIDSKTTTLQDHTTLEKQNKQTTKGNPQRSSSSYSESKTGQNEDKDVLEGADRNTDNMLCPSLTSTPVFTSTQTKLPLNNEVDFPDCSMILNNDGVGSYNKVPRENINSQNKDGNHADQAKSSSYELKNSENNLKDKIRFMNNKSDSNNLRQNLKVLVHDFTKPSNDRGLPGILNNFDQARIAQQTNLPSRSKADTNQTNTHTSEDGTSSPSILPQKVRMGHDKRSKFHERKRSSTSSSVSDVKRLKRDSSHVGDDACSVVLLSSDEEDNGRMESSVDMFGEGEKSNKDSSLEKNSDVDSSNKRTKLTTEKGSPCGEIVDNSGLSKPNERQGEMASPCASTEDQDNQKYKAGHARTQKYDDFPGFRKPDEPTFKNVEVFRKKDDRAKLKGFSCRECAEYYGSLNLNEEELKKRLKHCSRHRAKYSPPPSTPPGFWNLSFPETQEYMAKGMLQVEDENAPQLPKRKQRRRRLLGRNRDQTNK